MAISKNRLEELISKGSTVYTILQGGIEKVDLAKTRIFGRTNDYTFIDYWCDTFDQYIETSNERLFETRKEAEWALKYHATRTEELNLPMWEGYYDTKDTIFWCEMGVKVCLRIRPSFIDVRLDNKEVVFNGEATEENYEKACDLCLKLFKGEQE